LVREGFKAESTACINRIRGLLAELGLVFAKRPVVLRQALPDVIEDAGNELSTLALQRSPGLSVSVGEQFIDEFPKGYLVFVLPERRRYRDLKVSPQRFDYFFKGGV